VAGDSVERVSADIAAAKREREDTAERAEDPLDRPRLEAVRLQLARDRDDVVGCSAPAGDCRVGEAVQDFRTNLA